MSHRAAMLLAWSAWGLALALWVVAVWLRTTAGIGRPAERVIAALTFMAMSTGAALVASRRPESPFGWIIGLYGVLAGVDGAVIGYAAWTGNVAAAWLGTWIGLVASALITLALLFVPDGHLPSDRWRPLVWLLAAATVAGGGSVALRPGPLALLPAHANPLGLDGAADVLRQIASAARYGLLLAFALAAVSLVVRFRTARGEARQQLKWVAAGAATWVLATALIRVAPPEWFPAAGLAYLLALDVFVAAVAVAILRYRLYDIDLVISRALVYGTLAAAIGLVYVAVVVGLGAIVGTRGEPNLVLSLVGTALIALAFEPLRERLQRLANRLVYGEHATPYAVLAGLSRRIGNALSIDEVLPQLVEATTQGVGAARGRVRVYIPGGDDRAVAWPPEALGSAFEHAAPVLHQGQPVGEIAVSKQAGEVLTPAERALLEDLAAQAGPAFSNVRLTEELRASRQRIVAAQDAERRRIERDLHDGAQQLLVALSINLRLLQELVLADPGAAREILSEVQAQATEAVTTLRDLARGIYPPALADRGIVAALEGHLARSHPSASLDVDAEAAAARFAPAIEAAVYFCVLEALQNCAKHAPGAVARVSLNSNREWLRFAVADDGPGFDRAAVDHGSGLQGMADRVAAVGGTLEVRSATGAGTTILARLPASPNAAAHINGSIARR